MAAGNVCWGIELGAFAIKAIKLERSGDDVNVLEYAVIPHKKPLSTPDADPADTLRVSMGQLVSQHDLTGAPIAISIPGHSAFARFAKLPPVEPKRIPDIVKFEAVQQIPFPIEQVEWDYQTFISPDNPDVEVGIFAVMRDRVMDILNKWAEVGVTPDYVTIGPVAAYNAMAWDQNFGDKTPGTVILDIGTTATDLLVCEPGRVWIRTFQIGGHQFTEALVEAFKLSYSKAETLKEQAEQSKHARHILQAMRPVFGDIAQEVQRSIGYYQSSHRDANLTRLIALGSTFNLPGLRKYLGQQLQMEVIRLEKFGRASVEGARGAEFEAATGNLSTAYGLALQGLGFQHGIMVNLMPVSILREAVWKRKTKWFAAAAGLSVAAAGVAFYRPMMERATASGNDKDPVIQQTASTISNLKNKWKTDVESKFQIDFKAANVSRLLNNRDIYPMLLNDLGLMLAAADQKAGETAPAGKPPVGLKFVGFTTDYVGPGGGGDGQSGGSAPPPAPTDPAATELPVGSKIKGTLDLTTTREDAPQFLTQTVIKWLNDNAERQGVPYRFEKGATKFDLSTSTAPKATDAPGAPGTDAGPSGAPPQDDRPSGGSGGKLGGGGGNVGTGGGGVNVDPPPSGPSDTGGAGGNANLDQLAPLPPAPPTVQPGQTTYTFKVTFEAVMKAPEKPADPAADKSKDANAPNPPKKPGKPEGST
ncbi:MAG: type IV pilus assembly protein PilM [Phycisphaerales bacterium]|nr:type IV pilus assembly protein PilM [Phycisphaerales bacterium]